MNVKPCVSMHGGIEAANFRNGGAGAIRPLIDIIDAEKPYAAGPHGDSKAFGCDRGPAKCW